MLYLRVILLSVSCLENFSFNSECMFCLVEYPWLEGFSFSTLLTRRKWHNILKVSADSLMGGVLLLFLRFCLSLTFGILIIICLAVGLFEFIFGFLWIYCVSFFPKAREIFNHYLFKFSAPFPFSFCSPYNMNIILLDIVP